MNRLKVFCAINGIRLIADNREYEHSVIYINDLKLFVVFKNADEQSIHCVIDGVEKLFMDKKSIAA